MKVCPECGIGIDYRSKRCRSCAAKERIKHYPMPVHNVPHTRETIERFIKNRIGKGLHKGISYSNQKGKNHWNWKGGVSGLNIRNTLEWKEWKKTVFKRDNYTCNKCGKRNGNGKTIELNAHHIKPRNDYPNLIFKISNGITLCRDCHREIHYAKS